ncbi:MAG: putative Type I phosphodiesterase/nucleotide pyrophosphatase/phosphate transferase [Promethearchaeota archaeon]|nr:MAG: putative Type I phosphodiesterase/nucleotide pyrophosphatase/phosphate transferase [Candidatus Lokiarchaeota archaeon]
MNRKLLLIGIDQSIPYLLDKFLKAGKIPNIAKLVQEGVSGEAYCCPPCDTPTNWTTIATGATAAVHGQTSFYIHIPGESFEVGLEQRSRSQLAKYCNAEYLWNIADRAGIKPIVLNYPSGWPAHFKKGAMAVLVWPIPGALPRTLYPKSIKTYAKDAKKERDLIVKTSEGIEEINNEAKTLVVRLHFNFGSLQNPISLPVYIIDSDGTGYNSLVFKNEQPPTHNRITGTEWSDWIPIELDTNNGALQCLFKIRILELQKDGSKLKLEMTPIYNTQGWTTPESLGEKLVKNVLSYDFNVQEEEIEYKISDDVASYLEYAQRETNTIGKSIRYIKETMGWDMCYFHVHLLDSVNHKELAYTMKDSPIYSEENEQAANKNIENAYKIIDGLVGYLMDYCVDEHTIVAFVSDHGAMPAWKVVNIPLALMEAGLLSYKWKSSENQFVVDWKKTSAFPYNEPPFIWINRRGRDPQGIVSPAQYESVRDNVIDVLNSLRDPHTGDKIVKFALRREEAAVLGLNGERIGDIVYFLNPPYQIYDEILEQLNTSKVSPKYMANPLVYPAEHCFGAHAYYLPTQTFGDYSNSVPIVLKGPGLKEGAHMERPVNLIDLAPTFSHILKIPQPKHSQGRVLYQLLE